VALGTDRGGTAVTGLETPPRTETLTAASIRTAQDAEANLRLQAAARQKYTQAKRLRRLRMVVAAALLTAGPLVHFLDDGNSDRVAAVATIWILLARTVVIPSEKRWREQGAYIAELYDAAVLQLPKSQMIPIDLVSPEMINAADRRYTRRTTRFASRLPRRTDAYRRLRNWFAPADGAVGTTAAVVCQRGSAEYARRMAVEWAAVCDVVWVGVVVVYLAVALLADLQLSEYLLALALPSVPVVLDAAEAAQTQRATARMRADTVARTDAALRAVGGGGSPPDASLCRMLADNAYRWRTLGPGAPDLYYQMRRRRLDQDATAAAATVDRMLHGQDADR
jgi:hypothetical protein